MLWNHSVQVLLEEDEASGFLVSKCSVGLVAHLIIHRESLPRQRLHKLADR